MKRCSIAGKHELPERRRRGVGPVADDGFTRIGRDPFAPRPEERDPARRLRGRLAAPVTVWTASGGDGTPAGLTVSSLLVVEGEPPCIAGLLGPLTELWEAVQDTGRFVVHVLDVDQRRLADQFAGRYPAPPFDGVATDPSPWGPVLVAVRTRAYCRLTDAPEVGYSVLVRGELDRIELDEAPERPLVHHRGSYVTTAPRR